MTNPDSDYKWEQIVTYSVEGVDVDAWAKNIVHVFNQHGKEPNVYKFGFRCQLGTNRTGKPKARTIDRVVMDHDVVEIFKKAYGVDDNADLLMILNDSGNKGEIEMFFRDYNYGEKAINAYLIAEDPSLTPL